MGEKLDLSVVDQSPVRKGGTAADALRETIELAIATEKLGYKRFWVAEHHNLANVAGTSPEIMVGQIAARTRCIRVGSGGVMLPHYSAFKVAEQFRMLETLYPGRIDLGLGRAPGSDRLTMEALAYPRKAISVEQYPKQIADLLAYLTDDVAAESRFAELHAGPGDATVPDVWLLGSRFDSAVLAAEMGLPFSYAHFFGLSVEQGPLIVEMYRKSFRPSKYLSEPLVNVALQVLCAETDDQALRLASSRNVSRVKSVQGVRDGVPPVEEALAYPFRPDELAYLDSLRHFYLDGDPERVREALQGISETFETRDLSIVTIAFAFEDRVRSYQLVAEACELAPRP